MFIGCAPAILRPPLASIIRPQDVFQILLQPANQMQAAINALPFSPDLLIDKDRVATGDWSWRDSARGFDKTLASNTTAAEVTWPGYSGTNNRVVYALKQQAKVAVRVPYTGDGTSGRVIPHALGIKPGMMIVRRRDVTTDWFVWHTSTNNARLFLNATSAAISPDNGTIWGNNSTYIAPTDTDFTVSSSAGVNGAGNTYVSYLIAHDPDTTNGIVQCGGGNATLPWPAQWVLFRAAGATSDWRIMDAARGFTPSGNAPTLYPNLPAVESGNGSLTVSGNSLTFSGVTNPVWAAIRAPI